MAARSNAAGPTGFSSEESFARQMDAKDPLRGYRERFCIPCGKDGEPVIYFCGNSLGLMPRAAREAVEQELDDWSKLAVDAHFEGRSPWYSYHEQFRETTARLVGAQPGEVVLMNSLTVNLHLLLATFYRPTKMRYKILMDWPTFPSDIYAAKSQTSLHRFDPNEAVFFVRPREGEHTIRESDIVSILEDHGDIISLVLLAGVNFYTGQAYDIPRVVAAAQREGCVVGLDLAHAAGNVPLALHDWNIDFAVWCSYKYLNSGPGAVGGCFVHERHAKNAKLPRLAGWWGNDPTTRFQMHLQPDFVPVASAEAWQVSNPPIFSMAPLRASLAIFDEAGMPALRAKSELLTGYLQFLIDQMPSEKYEVITPRETVARGCQLSILAKTHPKELFAKLEQAGIKVDFREPNVIRVAPVPLYNTFHEVWRFAQILGQHG